MGSAKTISIIVAANIKGLEQGLGKANTKLSKFASGAARMGSLLTFGVTAPLAALGKSAFDTFSKFENGMMKVNTVTGATTGEFKMLTDEAKRLGATTQFTAQEVADLQLVLGRKGFDPTAIQNMEKSILDLALATGEDLSLAADVTASSINAFGLESNDAARVTNTLASAAANSSIQLSTFSTAFGHAGASASAVGVDLEELSAMMGVLMDNGIKASKAGTGLRTAFSKLNAEGVPFGDTLDRLASGQMSLNDATKLVGRTGANQLLILAKNRDRVKELTNEYKTNTGRLDEMAEAMGSTTHAKVKKMQSAIEGMKIEIGALLADALLPIISAITRWAAAFSNLNESTKKTILIVSGVLAAIGPALLMISAATAVVGYLSIAFTTLKGIVILFGKALWTSLIPIIKIVAILAALSAIFLYIAGNWDAFKERLTDLSWWKNMLLDMVILLIKLNPINQLINLINKGLKVLGKKEFKNPFDTLTDAIENQKDPEKIYEHQFTGIVEGITKGIEKTKKALKPAIDSFKGLFTFDLGGGGDVEAPLIEGAEFAVPDGDSFKMLTDYLADKEFEIIITPKMKFENFMADVSKNLEGAASAVGEFADKWGDAINTGLDIINQGLDNQMVKLENNYAKETELINNSSMNDEQKAAAQKVLDEKMSAEKGKILRKQAIMAKGAALISATINGAEAITKVAGQTGIGVIGAAPIMSALVGAQIAMIAAAPIPAFAQGGLVTGATMGLVGEGRGTTMSNPEVIAPLDKLKGMLGDSSQQSYIPNVTISGDDLLIVFDRANRRKERR